MLIIGNHSNGDTKVSVARGQFYHWYVYQLARGEPDLEKGEKSLQHDQTDIKTFHQFDLFPTFSKIQMKE